MGRESQVENCPDQTDLWPCLWGIVLIVSYWRRCPFCFKGSTTLVRHPGLYKKFLKNEPVGQTTGSNFPWFMLQVPTWVPALTSFSEGKNRNSEERREKLRLHHCFTRVGNSLVKKRMLWKWYRSINFHMISKILLLRTYVLQIFLDCFRLLNISFALLGNTVY